MIYEYIYKFMTKCKWTALRIKKNVSVVHTYAKMICFNKVEFLIQQFKLWSEFFQKSTQMLLGIFKNVFREFKIHGISVLAFI